MNLVAKVAELAESSSNILDVLGTLVENLEIGSRSDFLITKLQNRESDDMILYCDIKLITRQGLVANILAENTLPSATSPNNILNTHENFNQLLKATVIQPLTSSLQNFISMNTETKTDSLALPSFDGSPSELDDF